MIATLAHAPKWALEDYEGERMAETFARVARWYDVPGGNSERMEKITDHYSFFCAFVAVYGTRIFAGTEKKPQPFRPAPVTVTPAAPAGPSFQPAPVAVAPAPEPARANPQPGGEPPDPRHWSKTYIEGIGEVDIPPLAGAGGPH
jgi:hypothetical protein